MKTIRDILILIILVLFIAITGFGMFYLSAIIDAYGFGNGSVDFTFIITDMDYKSTVSIWIIIFTPMLFTLILILMGFFMAAIYPKIMEERAEKELADIATYKILKEKYDKTITTK